MGVEVMGEYACYFEKKGIKKPLTFYTGSRLLADLPPKAGRLAEAFLAGKGVEIKKERLNESTVPEGAYVAKCVGYTYNTPFMKEDFSESLAPNG